MVVNDDTTMNRPRRSSVGRSDASCVEASDAVNTMVMAPIHRNMVRVSMSWKKGMMRPRHSSLCSTKLMEPMIMSTMRMNSNGAQW